MEKFFKRDIQALEDVFAFVDDCTDPVSLKSNTSFAIKFAVEEIFTNMVKYNPRGTGDIAISLIHNPGSLVVRLVDDQATPFDPTQATPRDLLLPLEQRIPGGLGIQLVKEMVDRIEYDHLDNKSKITLTFRLDK